MSEQQETVEVTSVSSGHSSELGQFALALAKAQAEIRTAEKNEMNPAFKKAYADLADVWAACRAALTKNNLAVVQLPGNRDADVTVKTMLIHGESGQFVWSLLGARPVKSDPQGVGSTITYLRRYGLAAVVGVAPKDDDDDGNAGSGRGATGGAQPPAERPPAQRQAAQAKTASQPDGGTKPVVDIPDTVKPFVRRFEECTSAEAFRALLDSTRETFEPKTPEHAAYNHIVRTAAARLGIKPKEKAQ